jgi:hypothetical protein
MVEDTCLLKTIRGFAQLLVLGSWGDVVWGCAIIEKVKTIKE